jgi:hypothetical protein
MRRDEGMRRGTWSGREGPGSGRWRRGTRRRGRGGRRGTCRRCGRSGAPPPRGTSSRGRIPCPAAPRLLPPRPSCRPHPTTSLLEISDKQQGANQQGRTRQGWRGRTRAAAGAPTSLLYPSLTTGNASGYPKSRQIEVIYFPKSYHGRPSPRRGMYRASNARSARLSGRVLG